MDFSTYYGLMARPVGFAALSPEEQELERLRSRRAWEIGSVVASGLAGAVSLALFATGRFKAGYALAATSAVVGGTMTIIRISSDYDAQIEALRARVAEQEASRA